METIRLIKPEVPDLEKSLEYFQSSIDQSWYSNFGPCYELLCRRISDIFQGHEVTIIANATLALELILKTIRKNSNDKSKYVITPAYTFAATTTAILNAGLKPIYVDVDIDDWHTSSTSINEVVERLDGKILTFLPCSTFGTTPKKEKLENWRKIADNIDCPLIIDCAAGFGATWNFEESEVNFADAVVYSMHATKPFSVGEGGIVVGKKDLVQQVKQMSNFDFDPDRNFSRYGTNAKISEIMCSFALAKLDTYRISTEARKNYALEIIEKLSTFNFVKFQKGFENCTWQSLFVQIDNLDNHDQILGQLKSNKIEFRLDWSKPSSKVIPSEFETNLINTEILSRQCITLPLWQGMPEENLVRIFRVFESINASN